MAEQTENGARNKWMKRICITTVIISIMSIICTIVGAVAISKSAPAYKFPYSLGGAMIFGSLSILSSCCVMCVYCEYGGMSKDSLTNRICCWMIVVTTFLVIALIFGVGFSGIWGISKAEGEISLGRETNWSNQEIKQAETNRDYALASLLLTLPLSVLHIIAWCQCYKFLILSFGDSDTSYRYGHYERSRRQQLPRDQYTTRENRSAGVLFSIPVPEIYYGTTQQPSAVNQASESPNVPTVNPDLDQGISFSNQSVTTGSTDRPPPAYEDIEEGGLPTYDEVVNEGHYMSAGHTEFVVKL